MSLETNKKVLIIVGPTASGKTGLSLELAKRVKSEIISADSRQIFKEMTIGTAKPTDDELARVPHHFIDVYTPDVPYNAGQYSREARAVIGQLQEAEKLPIVVGGSGLYVKALVDGFTAEIEGDERIRASLTKRLETEGLESLYKQLQKVDPAAAESIHQNNSQRVMRALEVYLVTGKPFSEHRQSESIPADFTPVFIGLDWDRKELYKRINQRVDLMIDDGLITEVAILMRKGFNQDLNALNTVGYKEVFSYFNGDIDFEEMIRLIKRNSRHYAKRQLTWFRNDERIQWFSVTPEKTPENLASDIMTYFDEFEG